MQRIDSHVSEVTRAAEMTRWTEKNAPRGGAGINGWYTLPETNILNLEMDGGKVSFLGWFPGRCYVSFRECI